MTTLSRGVQQLSGGALSCVLGEWFWRDTRDAGRGLDFFSWKHSKSCSLLLVSPASSTPGLTYLSAAVMQKCVSTPRHHCWREMRNRLEEGNETPVSLVFSYSLMDQFTHSPLLKTPWSLTTPWL